jgi:hypothetical protein
MANAKNDLLRATKNTPRIKCASIEKVLYGEIVKKAILKQNYSEEDYQRFLKDLNFSYDSGYGSQELFGTVWLEDGTWLSREEYNGSEWWEHNFVPVIPTECL